VRWVLLALSCVWWSRRPCKVIVVGRRSGCWSRTLLQVCLWCWKNSESGRRGREAGIYTSGENEMHHCLMNMISPDLLVCCLSVLLNVENMFDDSEILYIILRVLGSEVISARHSAAFELVLSNWIFSWHFRKALTYLPNLHCPPPFLKEQYQHSSSPRLPLAGRLPDRSLLCLEELRSKFRKALQRRLDHDTTNTRTSRYLQVLLCTF